jgi:hypothetical protein
VASVVVALDQLRAAVGVAAAIESIRFDLNRSEPPTSRTEGHLELAIQAAAILKEEPIAAGTIITPHAASLALRDTLSAFAPRKHARSRSESDNASCIPLTPDLAKMYFALSVQTYLAAAHKSGTTQQAVPVASETRFELASSLNTLYKGIYVLLLAAGP